MNVDFINFMADQIEASKRFNLRHFAGTTIEDWPTRRRYDSEVEPEEVLHSCNTTACLAGWANAIDRHENLSDVNHAAELMGIDNIDAGNLFLGYGPAWREFYKNDPRYLHEDYSIGALAFLSTSDQAAALLRGIADGTYPLSDPE